MQAAAEYRPEIDGLRALSILGVVLYHARLPGFDRGYLGVDIFFVISGFLITSQLLREAKIRGTISMAAFYARRARRLLPAYLAMALGVSILAAILLLPIGERSLFGNGLLKSALFYYNIAAWRGGFEYDGVAADQQVLMHTWSLGVEEQFYLVWPWICLLALRVGRPLLCFSVIVMTSLLGAFWIQSIDGGAVFFLLPFRAWELGLGACVALNPWSPSPRQAGRGAAVGAALSAMTLVSGGSRVFGTGPALLVAIGTTLFIALGRAPNPASFVLGTRPMVGLGRMSYAWYLWHWPLLVVSRAVNFPNPFRMDAVAIVAGFVISLSTYLWVERPVLRIEIARPRRLLSWAAASLLMVALFGKAFEILGERSKAQPENAALLARLLPTSPLACETLVGSLGCDLSEPQLSDGPSLLLWGDSFAHALAPALSGYSAESGSRTRLLAKKGCPPLLGVVPALAAARPAPDPECRDWLESMARQLRRNRSKISGVVLAGRWSTLVDGDNPDTFRKTFDLAGRQIAGPRTGLTLGVRATLDFLESMQLRALIVGEPPEFPYVVPRCLWRDPLLCLVDRRWNATARTLSRSGLDAAIERRGDVRLADLFEPLCPGAQCNGGTLDEPLLTDMSHLSAVAARRRVLPILSRDLDWLRGVDVVSVPALPGR